MALKTLKGSLSNRIIRTISVPFGQVKFRNRLTLVCVFVKYSLVTTFIEHNDMIINKAWNHLFLTILFACVGVSYNSFVVMCHGEQKRNKVLPINVAGIELEVEVAVTPEEQILGLMYRNTLEDNAGMLFIFPYEKQLSFWMKDTRIPLSIAFIKANGRIVQIDSMKPYSLDTHLSKEKVKYALEMKEGWFKIHNVREGDEVKIPPTTDAKEMAGVGK